jgi:hypothetical protein
VIAIVLSLGVHVLFVTGALGGLADAFPWLTRAEAPPVVVHARLVTPPPPPPPVMQETSPIPLVAPTPAAAQPAPARKPRPAAPSPILTSNSPTAEPVASPTTGPAVAADSPRAAEPTLEAAPAAPPIAAAPPKPSRTAPLPPRARIQYEIVLESNNVRVAATQDWQMKDGRYKVRLAGGVRIVFVERTLSMDSEGAVTAEGLRPDRYIDERNGKKTIITFAPDEKSAQVDEANGNRKTVPMSGQAADLMSLTYDLAFNPDVPVGTVFTLANRDNLEEVRLVEKRDEVLATDSGNVNTRYYDFKRANGSGGAQVWLSLDRQWLPAKLRVMGRDGAISLNATRYDLNPPD